MRRRKEKQVGGILEGNNPTTRILKQYQVVFIAAIPDQWCFTKLL
jgi:hypothetical protein